VIGPETPSLRGVVENEYSGSLFPPDESDGLRRLMARAARQGRQVWAARGGAAARAATAQGWDVVGPMWRDLYRSISDEAHFRMSEAAAIDVG
jgi:hypothetical protein